MKTIEVNLHKFSELSEEAKQNAIDFPSYESIAERDFEYNNSDEAIAETIEANEYDFTKDGEIY